MSAEEDKEEEKIPEGSQSPRRSVGLQRRRNLLVKNKSGNREGSVDVDS